MLLKCRVVKVIDHAIGKQIVFGQLKQHIAHEPWHIQQRYDHIELDGRMLVAGIEFQLCTVTRWE